MMMMMIMMMMIIIIIIIILTNPTISIVKQYNYWNKNMKTTHLCVFLVIKNYK